MTISQSTREFVIIQTILIEELISETLGYFLGIKNIAESKSLGLQNTSLGFNQKVLLIQDLKGITSETITKFNFIMSIRNKFAHVSSVSNFENFFSVAKNGKEIKKKN